MERGKLWALVMDATRARILRGVRREIQQGESELVLRAPHHALRKIMSDGPDRTASPSAGKRRFGRENASDLVHEDAVAFVDEILVLLETHRKAGDFGSLAIYAPEDMLVILRKELSGGLKAVVTGEVATNLIRETEHDLMRIVAEHQSIP